MRDRLIKNLTKMSLFEYTNVLVNDQSDIDIIPNVTKHIDEENIGNKVKLVTAPERLGLIRARIFGAKQASGEVLVFLDSHVEGFTLCPTKSIVLCLFGNFKTVFISLLTYFRPLVKRHIATFRFLNTFDLKRS